MAHWIWHFGDFEIYHNLKLHMRRDEYAYQFPPFWRLDDCWHNVVFRKEVELHQAGVIRVRATGRGMLEIDGSRSALSAADGGLLERTVPAGRHVIEAKIMSEGLPCLYMEGAVETDASWLVCTYGGAWMNAGCSWLFRDPQKDPMQFPFHETPIKPVSSEAAEGGILFDFGRESFGKVLLHALKERVMVRFGESRAEALSSKAILQTKADGAGQEAETQLPPCAFRYVWVSTPVEISAVEQLLPVRRRGSFRCNDVLLNDIWDVSLRTFHLCSREFFLDGIKRDRWVWSGDAYQSYFINRYCFADREIVRRTILALRGKDPVPHHINTILDYSFYWLMSLEEYLLDTGDEEFIRNVWPQAVSLMEYCLARLDENGFAANAGNGWIFIDWADMDKDTCICAEQLLLMRALESMSRLAGVIGVDGSGYADRFADLRAKVDAFFWDAEKGAYIDSYHSGKRHVTRHANILALLFGYAQGEKRERILQNVLYNDKVTAIRTPYFKFYELDALCQAGDLPEVTRRMKAYWGAMLEGGATSVWEEYSPDEPMEAQYGMYGDPFGKSQCHAWGASPIYLLGRYYLGVVPTAPGWEAFDVRPDQGDLEWFEGSVPVGRRGEVHIRVQDGVCTACATVDGGTLYWHGKVVKLEKRVVIQLT